jgi:hypothetical protein
MMKLVESGDVSFIAIWMFVAVMSNSLIFISSKALDFDIFYDQL